MSSQSIQTHFRNIDGLSVRFAESERRGEPALLLSPWPESIYAYEPTWSRLAERHHLIAVDLPGFGLSERRDALMAPRAMGEFIIRIANAFELVNPHVVGPDIGTAASLFAAASHPGRLRSLVVGTGGTVFPLQLGEPLLEWVTTPDLEPYRRLDGREVVSQVMTTLERYVPTSAAREDYLSSFAGDRFVESMRYVRAYPAELPILADFLPRIETPVQIISGRRDRVVPPANAEYLHQQLPASKLDFIDAGHFVWEDANDEFAEIVTRWWDGGFEACSSSLRAAAI
jgi:pimeloyl-ACP methyl ester carboxylesterase